MNVLLTYPEYPDTFFSFKHSLHFVSRRAASPPLGLITVSALLPPTWQKKLVDLNTSPLLPGDLQWADYVFISAMHIQKESANRIIAECLKCGVKMVAGELLDGYYSIIQNTYSAKPYYKRVRQCLLNLGGLNRKQIKIDRYYIQAFFKSIFIIGIFNKGRAEYWKLFIWTLLNRPGLFPYAIMFTITGYHFRKVYGVFGN